MVRWLKIKPTSTRRLNSITNGSGHFAPNAKDLEGIKLVKENLKKQLGYTEDIRFVEHKFSN